MNLNSEIRFGIAHVETVRKSLSRELIGESLFQPRKIVGPHGHVEIGVEFPFDEVAVPTFFLEQRWTLGQLTGLMRTWSATSRSVRHDGWISALASAC